MHMYTVYVTATRYINKEGCLAQMVNPLAPGKKIFLDFDENW